MHKFARSSGQFINLQRPRNPADPLLGIARAKGIGHHLGGDDVKHVIGVKLRPGRLPGFSRESILLAGTIMDDKKREAV